ncbi:MAG TPA: hypothetical protein VFW85_01930 [Gaiellaceae bacterium]|nr:hypothetical protein [Gaiellaceae bacterium]
MAYVAGFSVVDHTLSRVNWPWFVACVALIPPGFFGYYLAYRPMFKLEGCKLDEDRRSRLAVVAAGFGGFLDHGGGTLDRIVLRAAGATEREANVRVTMLAGLEHGVLAVPCLIAASVLLGIGIRTPNLTFTIPWVAGPLAGGAIGYWAIRRYGGKLRGAFSVSLEAGQLLLAMFTAPRSHMRPLAGMLLFWLSDMVVLWCAMAAFGFKMNVGATVIAFGTAMIVTRRNGPLGGVGVLDLALPPTLWVCGAHWGPAVLGTFAYRFFTLWLPLPFALRTLPRLRRLIETV